MTNAVKFLDQTNCIISHEYNNIHMDLMYAFICLSTFQMLVYYFYQLS